MASAWIYQDPKQVKKHGSQKASFYVGWIDPEGRRCCKSCGKGNEGKKSAFRLKRKIEAELGEGTYGDRSRRSWSDFRKKYDQDIMPTLTLKTADLMKVALMHFERISKPKVTSRINTAMIDAYIRDRRKEHVTKAGRVVSIATVNRELRHLKSVLGVAADWGDIREVPKFRFIKEPKKTPVYVPADHFRLLYAACSAARQPNWVPNCPPELWWRSVLIFIIMTGWRIGQVLELKWSEVDLANSTATTCHEDNKGRRDMLTPLHPLIIQHITPLQGSFQKRVFPWRVSRRHLYDELKRICREAGVKPSKGSREHYAFHDLRRSFATLNAANLSLFELQALMQHQSLETTKLYVNFSHEANRQVAKDLFVPDLKPTQPKSAIEG